MKDSRDEENPKRFRVYRERNDGVRIDIRKHLELPLAVQLAKAFWQSYKLKETFVVVDAENGEVVFTCISAPDFEGKDIMFDGI